MPQVMPELNSKIDFRVPTTLAQAFMLAAKAEERTTSQQLRLLMQQYVERQDNSNPPRT